MLFSILVQVNSNVATRTRFMHARAALFFMRSHSTRLLPCLPPCLCHLLHFPHHRHHLSFCYQRQWCCTPGCNCPLALRACCHRCSESWIACLGPTSTPFLSSASLALWGSAS